MIEELKLRIIRSWILGDACCGTLMVLGANGWEKYCATLEDVPRDAKVYGETAIPEGTYEIKFREADTPMTREYRRIYSGFSFHLELQDVPNYKFVYIHHGNTAKNTLGCILLGEKVSTFRGNGFVNNSRKTYEPFYKMVSDALKRDAKVTIEIINEITAMGNA